MSSDLMPMWAVYDHPADHPTVFVARQQVIGPELVVTTDNYMVAPTLDLLRAFLQNEGLIPVPHSDDDDPTIVEIWV